MRAFFIQTLFWQLFSSYMNVVKAAETYIRTKNLYILTLMKLTARWLSPRQLSLRQLNSWQLSPRQLIPRQLSPSQLSPRRLSPWQLSSRWPKSTLILTFSTSNRLDIPVTWLSHPESQSCWHSKSVLENRLFIYFLFEAKKEKFFHRSCNSSLL